MSWRFGRSEPIPSPRFHGEKVPEGRMRGSAKGGDCRRDTRVLTLEGEKMTHFVGILDGSGDVWGVRFPDFPGCVGGGATPEVAISDAACALKDVMAHKQSGGFALPPASPLADIIASGEIADGESAVMIPHLPN